MMLTSVAAPAEKLRVIRVKTIQNSEVILRQSTKQETPKPPEHCAHAAVVRVVRRPQTPNQAFRVSRQPPPKLVL